MMKEAVEEADTFKDKLSNSIMGGAMTHIGILGELVCKSVNWEVKGPSTFDYDITLFGSTWDVKTKHRNVYPKLDYSVSVADLTNRQACDYYVFVSLCRKKGYAHVVGYYPSDMYWRDSALITRTTVDGSNGFKPRTTTHNMMIGDLYSPQELLPNDGIYNQSKVL